MPSPKLHIEPMTREAMVLGFVEGAMWAGYTHAEPEKYPKDSEVVERVLCAASGNLSDLYPHLAALDSQPEQEQATQLDSDANESTSEQNTGPDCHPQKQPEEPGVAAPIERFSDSHAGVHRDIRKVRLSRPAGCPTKYTAVSFVRDEGEDEIYVLGIGSASARTVPTAAELRALSAVALEVVGEIDQEPQKPGEGEEWLRGLAIAVCREVSGLSPEISEDVGDVARALAAYLPAVSASPAAPLLRVAQELEEEARKAEAVPAKWASRRCALEHAAQRVREEAERLPTNELESRSDAADSPAHGDPRPVRPPGDGRRGDRNSGVQRPDDRPASPDAGLPEGRAGRDAASSGSVSGPLAAAFSSEGEGPKREPVSEHYDPRFDDELSPLSGGFDGPDAGVVVRVDSIFRSGSRWTSIGVADRHGERWRLTPKEVVGRFVLLRPGPFDPPALPPDPQEGR